jgi:hypothetical protein
MFAGLCTASQYNGRRGRAPTPAGDGARQVVRLDPEDASAADEPKLLTIPDATHFKLDPEDWMAQLETVGTDLGLFTTYSHLRLADFEHMERLILALGTIATDNFSVDGPTMILDSGGFEFPAATTLTFQFCLRKRSNTAMAFHFHGKIVGGVFESIGWKRYTLALLSARQFIADADGKGVHPRTHYLTMATYQDA